MIKTAKELVAACVDVAKNFKTLYVMGCFGWPMNGYNKQRAIREYDYNLNSSDKISAASADTFGFDCVCFIKALLWGWVGDVNAPYGGAVYCSNGVPDIAEDAMIAACSEVSTDFAKIAVGEVVWMPGHIGVYVGDGLVVECTPIWGDGVQITACNCDKTGYNRRDWVKRGKLPYVTYEVEEEPDHWYRIRKSWEDATSQIGAYKDLRNAKAACPPGYGVFDWNGICVYDETKDPEYSLERFIRDVQEACGASVDGIAGKETLSKTVTISQRINNRHAVVKPLQKRLHALGYTSVGEADGIAGMLFTSAVYDYQAENGCWVDGEITAKNKTWRKLLGME